MRRMIAAGIGLAAAALWTAAPASSEEVGAGVGTAFIVNVTGTTTAPALDGSGLGSVDHGQATLPLRLPAGAHTVTVGPLSGPVAVGPGCQVVVVASVLAPSQVASHEECPVPRAEPGQGTVRFVNGTSNAGSLQLVFGETATGATAPWAASARVGVPAGTHLARITRPGKSGTVREETLSIIDGHAYTVVFSAAAERDPVLTVIDNGPQASPARGDVPWNSGSSELSAIPLGVLVSVSLFGLVVLLVCWRAPLGRRRSLFVLAAAMTVSTGCHSPVPEAEVGSAEATQRSAPAPKPQLVPVTVPATKKATSLRVPEWIRVGEVRSPVRRMSADNAPVLHQTLPGAQVAYFDNASGLGEPGWSYFAGHNVFGGQPAVLSGLEALPVGAVIEVGMAADTVRYRVEQRIVVPKARMPSWLFAPMPLSAIVVVTCTGERDPNTRLHSDNLIVVALKEGGV